MSDNDESEEDAEEDGSSREDESEPKIVKGWFKLTLNRTRRGGGGEGYMGGLVTKF